MFKSFLFSLIASLLVFSILAPSIETLVKAEADSVVVIDLGEEENNQKEGDKKFGEKNLFLSADAISLKFGQKSDVLAFSPYVSWHTDITQEIASPPPKA